MPVWNMQMHLIDVQRYVRKAAPRGRVSALPVCVSVSSGMLLSVLVVMLLTVFYKLLKVWRAWLETKSELAQASLERSPPRAGRSDSSTVLASSRSELSLTAEGARLLAADGRKRSASRRNSTPRANKRAQIRLNGKPSSLCFSAGRFGSRRRSSTLCR